MFSVPNRPQSDKESVKLLTVKTISHESGKLPDWWLDEKLLFQNRTWILFCEHNQKVWLLRNGPLLIPKKQKILLWRKDELYKYFGKIIRLSGF